MTVIKSEEIIKKVQDKLVEINIHLCPEIEGGLKTAKEESEVGKELLQQLLENAQIAREEKIPLCQDTGVVIALVRIGEGVKIEGGTLQEAINSGVARGYEKGLLRKSLVKDPLYNRENTGDNTPAIIHTEIVPGDKLVIELGAKGGGSENMSQLKMLKPADGPEGVKRFVQEVVEEGGPNPCPPLLVGVGVGGSMEKAALLAKKALFLPLDHKNPQKEIAALEEEILQAVNGTGVGPLGLGGRTTALGVNILPYPCHIASLPVAVNLNCHSSRHGKIELGGSN